MAAVYYKNKVKKQINLEGTMDTMTQTADRLLNRISVSTCSFTTASEAIRTLEENGFEQLYLSDVEWQTMPGGNYYVNVNDSAVYAFSVGSHFDSGEAAESQQMLRLAACHTDHPCLYVKSKPEMKAHGYGKLNVEVYGGAILNTWLDRPLSVAGKVVLKSEQTFAPEVRIVDMEKPLFTIPNLAIHLNREVNKGIELNRQTDMTPIAGIGAEDLDDKFFVKMIARRLNVSVSEILDYELYLYNCDAGDLLGMNEEMISAPRLDNITSVEACLQGICHTKRDTGINGILLFDNEEIGSRTRQGADTTLLPSVLEKLYTSLGVPEEAAKTAIRNGFALS